MDFKIEVWWCFLFTGDILGSHVRNTGGVDQFGETL